MSQIDKLREQFFKKPTPIDIPFSDVERLFTNKGCLILSGGNHLKVVHKESGTVIPIPTHDKFVQDVYIKQLKKLLIKIEEEEQP